MVYYRTHNKRSIEHGGLKLGLGLALKSLLSFKKMFLLLLKSLLLWLKREVHPMFSFHSVA